ncbi:hypothetical protein CN582_25240 [Bacillus wiedmannii]|uniref:molybdopterin-binding protein n=1 Tax=Bacillus wiedmannii TaxID=1890302 RepID=UPI000BF53349|nr:molybdopterin-binding protein [Bacillus wiedmannii]PEP92447.1 hypothetical protein CN582_25240 [Bacillus wiedmannii]
MKQFSIIITGKELFCKVKDINGYIISSFFSEKGYKCREVRIIDDNYSLIRSTILELAARNNDFVVVTGGLGGSGMDFTRKVALNITGENNVILGKFFRDNIKQCYRKWKCKIPKGVANQLLVPKESIVFHNKEGSAPAFKVDINNTPFFFLTGVPQEVESFVNNSIGRYIVKNIRVPNNAKSKMTHVFDREAELTISKKIEEFNWFTDKDVEVYIRVDNNSIIVEIDFFKPNTDYMKKWNELKNFKGENFE